MEQPLSSFGNWFKDLRFADAILKPEDGNKIWHFCHVLLSPKSVTNMLFGRAPKHFYSCARRFCEDIFHASPSLNEQIERAMNQAVPIGSKILLALLDFFVYCACWVFRFRCFVLLLGVNHHLTAHNPSIQSWQRNKVGLFMIIQVIKQCASIKGVTKIELFLQCSEPSAIHFHAMIG